MCIRDRFGGESTGEKLESYKPAYFYGGIPQLDYSATAVDTGIKWLNGRKIYRKTFIFGSMGTSGTLDIPIGEAAIEEVVHLRGGVPTAGGVGFELLPFTHQATLNYQKGLTVSSLASNPTITIQTVSYTHLRAHETVLELVCRLLPEKKKTNNKTSPITSHTNPPTHRHIPV